MNTDTSTHTYIRIHAMTNKHIPTQELTRFQQEKLKPILINLT